MGGEVFPKRKGNGYVKGQRGRSAEFGKLPSFDGMRCVCGFCGEEMWMRGRHWRHARQVLTVKFFPAVFFFPEVIQGAMPKTSEALRDLRLALKEVWK